MLTNVFVALMIPFLGTVVGSACIVQLPNTTVSAVMRKLAAPSRAFSSPSAGW